MWASRKKWVHVLEWKRLSSSSFSVIYELCDFKTKLNLTCLNCFIRKLTHFLISNILYKLLMVWIAFFFGILVWYYFSQYIILALWITSSILLWVNYRLFFQTLCHSKLFFLVSLIFHISTFSNIKIIKTCTWWHMCPLYLCLYASVWICIRTERHSWSREASGRN